jgi:hypothetical protein
MENSGTQETPTGGSPNTGPNTGPNFGPPDPKLIGERVIEILKAPVPTWQKIKAESLSVNEIYTRYLVFLCAITPIAMFIKTVIIGFHVPMMGTYRTPFFSGLIEMLISYALALAAPLVISQLIENFGPKFEIHARSDQVFRLLSFSMMPSMLAGILLILSLAFSTLIALLSLYCLYILYLGIPIVTDVPEPKRLPFLGLLIGCGLLMGLAMVIAGSIFA